MGTATATTDCAVLRIEKKAMMQALHREHTFSDLFVAYLLARDIRYEEDLVDQLFNSSEKRLARVLLMVAHFGKEGAPETVVPKISQETLAENEKAHPRPSSAVQEIGLYSNGAGCKSPAHFSTSFFTISFRAAIPRPD